MKIKHIKKQANTQFNVTTKYFSLIENKNIKKYR